MLSIISSEDYCFSKVFLSDSVMIINQIETHPMNHKEAICCICKRPFSETSQPRMMPYCEHNACTSCLKHSIQTQKCQKMVCAHCGHEERIKDIDIEYFPKNISLTKMLKERSISVKNSNLNHQSSQDTTTSASVINNEIEFCEEHKKKMEIICLNDRIRLCPHCALFGSHKDHQFKTINQVNELMDQRYSKFLQYKSMKTTLDSKINSSEFKETIVKKIGQEKDRLILDIKKKFAKITENIKLAEKKAYEDVIKNFKTVYSRILSLMKEENESQKKYKIWELKCTDLFEKAAKMKRIEDKAILYIDGPLEICLEGSSLLHRLQTKINNSISSIETLISQIKIVQNPTVSNSVFNYINVVLEDNETLEVLGYVHQEVLSPNKIKEEQIRKQHKIEFGADHLSAQRMSLSPAVRKKSSKSSDNLTKLCSEKRPSSKVGTSTPERGSVDTLIEQFCERDLDTLDLTNYSLSDIEIYEILAYLRPIKKLKGLKLVKNKLTNEGLMRIMQLIPNVTNLNVSFNLLCDDSMITLLDNRHKIPYLRIINLSNNKINERRTKTAIDQLKKQGLIVTI